MTLEDFLQLLRRLSPEDLRSLATQMASGQTSDDELRWWQATLSLDRSLRRQHLSIHGSSAANVASRAVQDLGSHANTMSADQIAAVARAAAEVARTYVAHDPSADPCYFLRAWSPTLSPPDWAECGTPAAA
jgi:hypothetical protein